MEIIRARGEHVTRMYAERLVKISRDNIPAGRKCFGCLKRKLLTNPMAYEIRRFNAAFTRALQ